MPAGTIYNASSKNPYKMRARRGKGRKLPPPQERHVKTLIKRAIDSNIEDKVFIYNNTDSPSTTGSVIDLLSGISRGDTDDDFAGDKIRIKKCTLRFQMVHADSTQVIRLILFQFAASGPGVGSVLESAITATGDGILAPYEKDYRSFLRILYDRTFALSTYTYANSVGTIIVRPKLLTHFTEAGTIVKNGLYMLLISDSGAATHPIVDYVAETLFEDA